MRELFELAEVEPKKGKIDQKFLKKLYDALSEQFDDDPKEKKWKALSPEAQQWYNDAVDPATNGDDLPDLPGDDDDEDEADAKPAKKGKVAKADKGAKLNGKGKNKAAKASDEDEADEETEDEADEDEPKAKKGAKGKAAKADKKEAKGKAKAKKGNGGAGIRRGPPAYEDNQKIKVLVKSPHREGTKVADRYALLKSGMTVGAARKAGLSLMDLKCDVDRGNLSIS